jgi:glyoxylase-like metal-dependent hydrolase (beta-lactamase superfamily II)
VNDDDALRFAAERGVFRYPVPTPFAVGPMNAYLIEDEPLTLIDSGPNSALSLDVLERGLAERGHAFADLKLLIITHQHADHLGLADVLARRCDAEVAAFGPLGNWLDRFHDQMELDDRFAVNIMLRHGVSREVTTALRAVTAMARAFGSHVHVTRPLLDGDVVELAGRRLYVYHRPGHSPSDIVFHDPEHDLLLAGDHLLGRISSNPVITRPLDADEELDVPRPRALMTYIDSMKRSAELDATVVLGGHGPPITDHRALIAERLDMHERRAEKIHGILLEHGPMTAHAIATTMWGRVALTQAYLTLSEVIGHLDLLVADGRAREIAGEELTEFEALAPS